MHGNSEDSKEAHVSEVNTGNEGEKLTFIILPKEGKKHPSFREFVAQQNAEARQHGDSTTTIVIGWILMGLIAVFSVGFVALMPLFWFGL